MKQPVPQVDTSGPISAEPDAAQRAAVVSRLFQEHNDALIGFLLARVGSEQEARDVAQEAYVKMLELDKPGAVSFLRAYLFKTAANLATDRARQRAAHSRIQQQWIMPFESRAQPISPEHVAGAREELDLLRNFMQELPPRCREAFYLHRFRDLTAEEIAQRLGVTKRMVRKYLFRAFQHCRTRLDAARGAAVAKPERRER
jgi:RNA polymerase sigma factor (sigma-70 family)